MQCFRCEFYLWAYMNEPTNVIVVCGLLLELILIVRLKDIFLKMNPIYVKIQKSFNYFVFIQKKCSKMCTFTDLFVNYPGSMTIPLGNLINSSLRISSRTQSSRLPQWIPSDTAPLGRQNTLFPSWWCPSRNRTKPCKLPVEVCGWQSPWQKCPWSLEHNMHLIHR